MSDDRASAGKVGYGHPPVHSRFKKGQSGNPRGRRKHTKNLRTDLAEELRETIRVREGDREYRISKQRAVLKALVAQAVKGDMRAATSIIQLCARAFGLSEQDSEPKASPADQEILDEFIEREIARRRNESEVHRHQPAPVELGRRSRNGRREGKRKSQKDKHHDDEE